MPGYFHLPDVIQPLLTIVLWIISSSLVDHHALAGGCCNPMISESKSLKSTEEKRREMGTIDLMRRNFGKWSVHTSASFWGISGTS